VPDDLRAPLSTRLRTPALVVVDALLALVLLTPALARSNGSSLAVLLAALSAAPIAVRRIWPASVFAVVLVASIGAVGVTGRVPFAVDPFVALSLVVYPLALRLNERRATVAVVVSLAAIVATGSLLPPGSGVGPAPWVITSGCLTIASWALGRAVHQHRRFEQARSERTAAEAATHERLRVAREVHDLLAHGMSVIAVQAGVANHVIDSNPQEARRVLASIAGTSRTGLAELRGLMSALRSTHQPEPAELRPVPGIDGLPGLLDGVAATGLHTELSVRGEPRPVPPGIDLAVYRIVQESLTNIVRHADAERCEVALSYLPDALTVEIVDDGTGCGRRDRPPGHGLVGMRERAEIYGGTVDAGPVPAPHSGFRVVGRLPLREGITG
jgi:signal transduction histidine kinase